MPRYELHKIAGTRCERRGGDGPFRLDAEEEEFVVEECGRIRFPDGVWGIDMACEFPACGFAARLGDFYEWVQVSVEVPSWIKEAVLKIGDRIDGTEAPARDTLPADVADAISGILWHDWQEDPRGIPRRRARAGRTPHLPRPGGRRPLVLRP